mmetsp:Transcript_35738/g.86483  ORF Transcript_35738/g.86483 Transcript_35738/m.86483 type:complete len:154 (+) Transcript_35738:136-597(+)|eukprot:CAMPEP_0113632504 /NCGR_PEP_ID=MMETSP0017_2-20120614/16897_1 /TAXON_ID=2856 /ORGANISM="Cylindrotheca closterium" /LENGTH=153 /DNA_ID=CAMNT_0000543067 /DNA_START=90 /DNA_END=551 /DNA_ORIENTATION=- /assembly_acc=CAM_ASM_000147
MKLSLLLCLLPLVSSFTTVQKIRPASSQLEATSRRQTLEILTGAAAMGAFPQFANAFSQQLDDYAFEPQQQATDGKFDLNSAFVGEYKVLRGMFPTAAGKIASHGPYKKVKDIYKIPGLTDHDIAMFKQYENEFSVHIPGRSFYERINARVST